MKGDTLLTTRRHTRMGKNQAMELLGRASLLYVDPPDSEQTYIYASKRPMLGVRVPADNVFCYLHAEAEINVMAWVLTNGPLEDAAADSVELELAYDPQAPYTTGFEHVILTSFHSSHCKTIVTDDPELLVEQLGNLMRNPGCYHIDWYIPNDRFLAVMARALDDDRWHTVGTRIEPEANMKALDSHWIDKILVKEGTNV